MSKPVILCVDDEKMILVSLKEQLKRHFGGDYRIETVESGEEALEVLEELNTEQIELPIVIADQIMPGMKGDALLIHLHHLLPRTLKILLTGQANADAVGNAVNYAKLYRYIAKPWEEADLKLTVAEALRSYFQDKQLEEQNRILQQLNRELERFNATLEQQVRDRTAELEAQKLELAELNASKDKFFSIISHDLRSPFNALLGFAQILSENLERYTLEEIQQKVIYIRTAAERLYALLENLLTWSRIQRGAIEYDPEPLDLAEIVEDNVALFMPNAEQKQIRLHNSIQAQTFVYADYSMLNTVIRNLTSNALKFTSSGDHVSLSVMVAERLVEVAVSDTGVGIPAEVLPTLLRIDTHHTRVGTAGEKGTGLGLVLCKELIEKNGGQLWVESEAGKGSTFKFTLPRPPSTDI
ncbi:response regulator receiver protein [Candidatus Vecturithrix granuli]|uniref:histidine kinase n=1 Tax=Vecturithrix granuli TaxID=1499967 RepID=A0A0S6WA98_VECG1|nr:response regulator receiver protein [Candidatus Vecturithrix granuli]